MTLYLKFLSNRLDFLIEYLKGQFKKGNITRDDIIDVAEYYLCKVSVRQCDNERKEAVEMVNKFFNQLTFI